MEYKEAKEIKEVKEMIEKIKKLQQQINSPKRDEMIKALSEAQQTAPTEIMLLEFSQGDRYYMPFADFTDADLYRKLSQYQQGLENACIAKLGKKAFDELLRKEDTME